MTKKALIRKEKTDVTSSKCKTSVIPKTPFKKRKYSPCTWQGTHIQNTVYIKNAYNSVIQQPNFLNEWKIWIDTLQRRYRNKNSTCKECSVVLVIEEMQIKCTVRYH